MRMEFNIYIPPTLNVKLINPLLAIVAAYDVDIGC